ncbi:hypothetical protein ACFW2Y_28010 [Streptomyces sp. NPDC058877]|uniref:hypothetical protein n=1 Tax=unclassified Streptomyces TaxID=2593676 RepID=UPI0036766743
MTRSGTAAVCENGESYRAALLSRLGDAGALDRAAEALRTGVDPITALDELDAALQASGDPRGLYGALRGAPDPSAAAGITSTAPGESVYLCPTERCPRFWLPEGTGTVARCSLSEAPLRRRKL